MPYIQLFGLIAFGPAILLLRYVYNKDRLEKEPRSLIAKLVGFGALSVIPACILETVGRVLIGGIQNFVLYYAVYTFIIVAISEESCKYLVMRWTTWKSPEFNCTYDGVLYAVFVSLGFAILENLLYILQGGLITGLFRAVTSIPGHCFFGVFMGVMYAKAKREQQLGNIPAARKFRLLGIIVAAVAHGLYDFLALLGSAGEYWAYAVFAMLLIAMYILGFMLIKRESAADMYIVPPAQASPEAFGSWTCSACGSPAQIAEFCANCGAHRPQPLNGYSAAPAAAAPAGIREPNSAWNPNGVQDQTGPWNPTGV